MKKLSGVPFDCMVIPRYRTFGAWIYVFGRAANSSNLKWTFWTMGYFIPIKVIAPYNLIYSTNKIKFTFNTYLITFTNPKNHWISTNNALWLSIFVGPKRVFILHFICTLATWILFDQVLSTYYEQYFSFLISVLWTIYL